MKRLKSIGVLLEKKLLDEKESGHHPTKTEKFDYQVFHFRKQFVILVFGTYFITDLRG